MNATRRRTGALALFALAALSPAALGAQTGAGGLTLDEAVSAARENNPDLLQQKNDTRSARAAVRAANADFLPSANASAGFGYTASGVQRFGSEVFGTRPDYYSSNYQVGLTYDLSGAKLMQPRIARANERATVRRIEGAEADLVNRVAQQYLTALQAGEQVGQAEREVARTLEHERLARARLDVGAGTPLDLRRAEVQRGQAEVQLLQARNTHQTEVLRLGLLMGAPIPATTPLTSRFELAELDLSAASLVTAALRNNPGLLAARASADAARTNVRAARSQYLPSMSFQMGYVGSVYSAGSVDPLVQSELVGLDGAYAGCLRQNEVFTRLGMETTDCQQVNPENPAVEAGIRQRLEASNPDFPFGYERQPLQASLTFSLPLFNGLDRERRIEEARVSQQDADLQVRARELQLRTDIETAILTIRTAYGTAQLQAQVAERAAEELRLAQERFRFGAASSVEVTDAQTSLAEAERARIDAVYAYHKTLAALEALIGQRLR